MSRSLPLDLAAAYGARVAGMKKPARGGLTGV